MIATNQMRMGIKRKWVEREIRRRIMIDGVGNVVVVKINTVGVMLVNVVGMVITMEEVEEMVIGEGLRKEIGHLQENLVVVILIIMAEADQALGIGIIEVVVICMEGDHLVEVGGMTEGDTMIVGDHHRAGIMISDLVVAEDEMKGKEIFMVVATIMDPLLHLCSSKKRVVVGPFQAKVLEAIHVQDQDLVVILRGLDLDQGVTRRIRLGEALVHIHVVILDPHREILETKRSAVVEVIAEEVGIGLVLPLQRLTRLPKTNVQSLCLN